MSSNNDFRKQIQTNLALAKISIAKLSRLTDLHSQTIYNYLAGRSDMTSANLTKVLNTLDTLVKKGDE